MGVSLESWINLEAVILLSLRRYSSIFSGLYRGLVHHSLVLPDCVRLRSDRHLMRNLAIADLLTNHHLIFWTRHLLVAHISLFYTVLLRSVHLEVLILTLKCLALHLPRLLKIGELSNSIGLVRIENRLRNLLGLAIILNSSSLHWFDPLIKAGPSGVRNLDRHFFLRSSPLLARIDLSLLIFQLFNSFDNFDSVQSNFNIQIILQIGVCDEVYHAAIHTQLLEILLVHRQSQTILQPYNSF